MRVNHLSFLNPGEVSTAGLFRGIVPHGKPGTVLRCCRCWGTSGDAGETGDGPARGNRETLRAMTANLLGKLLTAHNRIAHPPGVANLPGRQTRGLPIAMPTELRSPPLVLSLVNEIVKHSLSNRQPRREHAENRADIQPPRQRPHSDIGPMTRPSTLRRSCRHAGTGRPARTGLLYT